MNNEESKIVPQLRFPEFEEEWKIKPLEKVLSIFQGYAFSSKDSVEEGTRWLKIADVSIQKMNHENPSFLPFDFIESYSKFLLKKGDYVMALTRPILNGKLKISIVDETFHNSLLNQRVGKLKSKENLTLAYYLLQTNTIIKNIENSIAGSEPPNLSMNQIANILIPLPSNPNEQQKIAACLSSLDEVLTAETEKLDLLQDHKKGLLQQLFPAEGETQPKFRFPEFKDDGDWEETTLGELAKFRRGSFPQPYGLEEWYDDENGMPFIQVYDVDTNLKIKQKTKRLISKLAAQQSVFIEKGTIIITIQGSIGRVAITQYDAYIDRTLLLFQKFYKSTDKLFFAYVIQMLFEIEKQKAPGGIIKTITKEVLTSFVIKLPKIQEQQKIASCLSAADDLIAAQKQQIEQLQEHKKGLLQQLFPNVNDRI